MNKKFFYGLLLLLFAFPFLGRYFGVEALAAEDTGAENPSYTLTCVDGTRVSTKSEDGKVTVLLFGTTTCSKTKNTLTNISKSSWVGSSNLRVIFEDCDGNNLEDVMSFGSDFGCKEISFCYGEYPTMMNVMYAYTKLFGMSGGSWPVTVLIDGNNRVRKLLTGTLTADTIKAEIQKFAMLENEMPGTGVGDGTGNANPGYTFTAVDGKSVSTTTNAGQVSVVLFGTTSCGYTKGTVREIARSAWIGNTDARIIFAEINGATLAEMNTFASGYGHERIIFCYDDTDPYGNINKAMWAYLRIGGLNGGTYPFTAFIDGNNKVREVLTGPLTAEEIKAKIDAYAKASDSGTTDDKTDNDSQGPSDGAGSDDKEPSDGAGSDDKKPEGGTGSGNEKPGTGSTDNKAGISRVSGLKAASKTDSVKLTWKKVSGAERYYIYQYNTSKKKWSRIADVSAKKVSYTVKKLKAATGYRFGVKAFRKQGGKSVLSGSYASVYTATKPGSVKFRVTAGKKKAQLKWNRVKGVSGYTVYYKASAKAAWKKLKSVKGTSYTVKKLKSKKSYSFTVRAYKNYKGKTYTGSSQTKRIKIK